MGLLDNYTGIGMSPRPRGTHQDIIMALGAHLYHDFIEDFFIRSESCIDPNDLNSQAPDIILLERESERPVLFIEITTTAQHKVIHNKIIGILKAYPGVQEAFMYDYEANTWKRYANHKITDDSYSEFLDLDLGEIVS